MHPRFDPGPSYAFTDAGRLKTRAWGIGNSPQTPDAGQLDHVITSATTTHLSWPAIFELSVTKSSIPYNMVCNNSFK